MYTEEGQDVGDNEDGSSHTISVLYLQTDGWFKLALLLWLN